MSTTSPAASPIAPRIAHERLKTWVREIATLTGAHAVSWCDGSAGEYDQLCQRLVDAGTFERLSDAKRPNIGPRDMRPIRPVTPGRAALER
jgi:GTP-dependent phosphoenolpyruvate carboxykinase